MSTTSTIWPGPGRHDRDPVGEVDRLLDVVRDEEDGLLRRQPDPLEVVGEGLPGQRVDRRERLVHEEHAGIVYEALAIEARCRMPPDSSSG